MNQYKKTIFTVLAWLSLSLFAASSIAANMQPDELIKTTSEKVLSALEKNKEKYAKQPEQLTALVNDIILPHMDFLAMSRLALGKNWRSANEAQQGRFVEAFKSMLIRTYSKSLTEYAGQEIKFLPYRGPEDGKSTVTIKTVISQNNGPEIPIDYSMRIKDDIWKVYDIKIDGISLVTNYRSSFSADINRVGMDGLIEKLLAKTADQPEKA